VITVLATLSKSSSRHLEEIGLLIAAVGGVALVVAAILGIMEYARRTELGVVVVAGVLLAAGLVLALVGVHGGL
jgi:hypothetical protein